MTPLTRISNADDILSYTSCPKLFVTNNNILGLIKVHSTRNIECLKGERVTDRIQIKSLKINFEQPKTFLLGNNCSTIGSDENRAYYVEKNVHSRFSSRQIFLCYCTFQ